MAVSSTGITILRCVLVMFVVFNGIWAKKGKTSNVIRRVVWVEVPKLSYWVSNNRPADISCTAKHARSLVLICNRSLLVPQPTRRRGGTRTLNRIWNIRASDLADRRKSVFRCRCRAWGKQGRPITTNNTVIKVSYLKETFGRINATHTVVPNNTIALKCNPPRGNPRPSIRWTKDGNLLGRKERKALHIRLTKKKNLLIKEVEAQHTGKYQCIVKNFAGTRKGPVISLIVRDESPDAISMCNSTNGSLSNCTVPPQRPTHLFIATQTGIKHISLDISRKPFTVKKHKDFDTSAEDVAVSTYENSLYWTDKKSIKRVSWQNGEGLETTIAPSPPHVEGIAEDWINKKLYWTDSTLNTIQAVDLRNNRRAVVIRDGLNKPGAIAVDPLRGYMYWTEWGGDSPRIVKAGMDGSNMESLITQNILQPNGLVIDYTTQRLYWTDGYYGTVQTCWLNGSDRSTIVNGTGKFEPYGVAVLDDYVFWTDRETNSLYSIDKIKGGEERALMRGLSRPSGISILNSNVQPPGISPCGNNNAINGGCSHVCLASPGKKNFRCVCDADNGLSEDGKICRSKAEPDSSTHPPSYPESSNTVLNYILIAAVALLTMALIFTQFRNSSQNRKVRLLLRNRQQHKAALENEISTAFEATDATGAAADSFHGNGAALPEERSLLQGNDKTSDQTNPSEPQRRPLTLIKINHYDTRLQQYGGVAAIGDNTTVTYAGTEQDREQESTEERSQESAEEPV